MALDYQPSFFQKHRRGKPDNDLKDTFEDIPYFFAIVIFFSVIIYLLPIIVVLDTVMFA